MKFKTDNEFSTRKSESDKITQKYPNRIPIIIEKAEKCILNDIDKHKYLVPKDLNMNQFIYIIRKRIKLDNSQSIFFIVGNNVCPSNSPLSHIYEEHKDKDGFLYIIYTSENTFG
jgi:GABA(A) receptor-associated protein|tara:strand:+ start:3105 stop:3449 length:345 start_codon:yes stop_codon:yes gene_type:complete